MDTLTEDINVIKKYFPGLADTQLAAFSALSKLYNEWNAKINVISRNDTGNLYERHVLHSLAIAKFLGPLAEGTKILDLGCGGGFPGIPLAIMYPQCHFHLIDRIGKKILVATEITKAIGLSNVTFQHGDSGECHQRFNYVVSRAVMSLPALVKASSRNIETKSSLCNRYAPGLICLKGGELCDEIDATPMPAMEVEISDFFSEEFFQTKKVVYVPFAKSQKSCSK